MGEFKDFSKNDKINQFITVLSGNEKEKEMVDVLIKCLSLEVRRSIEKGSYESEEIAWNAVLDVLGHDRVADILYDVDMYL